MVDYGRGGFMRRGEDRVMDLTSLSGNRVLRGAGADVAVTRERSRQRRLARLTLLAALVCLWMWIRLLSGRSMFPGLPRLDGPLGQSAPLLLLVVILGAALFIPLLGAGRSPHVLYRSSEIDTSLED